MIKKIFTYIIAASGILVGLTLLLLAGALILISTETGRRTIIDRVNAAIPGSIEWRFHRIDLFQGRIAVEDLAINDPEGSPVVTASRIFAEIDLAGLLQRELRVDVARIEQPRFFLTTDPQRHLNLAAAFVTPDAKTPETPTPTDTEPAPDTASPGFNIRVNSFDLTQGYFQFQTAPGTSSDMADIIILEDIGIALRNADLARRSGRLAITVSGGRMDMADIRIGLEKFHLDAGLDQGRLAPLDIDILFVDGTALTLTGAVNHVLDQPEIALEMDFKAELADIGRMLNPGVDLSGPVHIQLTASGSAADPDVSLAVRYGNGGIVGMPVESIGLAAQMSERRVHIRRFSTETEAGDIDITGDIDLQEAFPDGLTAGFAGINTITCDLAAKAELPDLSRAAAIYDINDDVDGSLAFTASINGSMRQPAAKLFIRGKDLAARDRRIGDLTADLSLAEGRVTLDPVRLVNGGSIIVLTGTADVQDPMTAEPIDDPGLDITLSGDAVRIGDFVPDLDGLVAVNGHIHGSMNQPHGHLRLQADDLDLGMQQIHQINLDARLDETRIHIDPLNVLLSPDQSITVTGWVNTEKEYDFRMISDPISPTAIKALADIFPEGGRIILQASGTGSFDDPRGDAEIRISELRINDSTLPSLVIELSVADQTVHVTTTPKSRIDNRNDAADRLRLDGRFLLDSRDFSVRLNLDHVDLAPYLKMAAQPELSGHLTAQIRADGNLSVLDQVRADIHIADLSLFRNAMEIIRSNDFRTTYDSGLLSIPGCRLTLLTKGFFDIRGTGRVDGDIELHVKGTIPVTLVESFTDAVTDTGGKLDISVELAGPLKDPAVNAVITLADIRLTLPETAQRLHDVNGDIHITTSRIRIHDFRAMFDTGDFRMKGAIDLAGFQPVKADVTLAARALPIKIPDTLDLLINAGITLSGDAEKSLLSGDITMLEGLYYRDITFNLMQTAGDMSRGRRQFDAPSEPAAEGPPLLNQMAIDINVRHRNPFVVDNNVAVLRIRPDLRIHGTPAKPLVSGRADVTDGAITFYNTEFTVDRGIIDFINPYKIEPLIDIAAQSQVRHWTITLAVTGPPDDLSVVLNSSPAEEHGDIVSLLVVGKTTRELAGGEGGGAASPEQLLANLLAEQLQKNLQVGTGLDIIELEYKTDSESTAGDDIRLTVGKELSRRLTLLYGVEQKSGLVVHKSTAVYKLLENLSVNAFQDTEGAFGGEMRYRLEFR